MGIEKNKRVGIYLTAAVVIDNPDYLTTLRDELGLNLVILGYFWRSFLRRSPRRVHSTVRHSPTNASTRSSVNTSMVSRWTPPSTTLSRASVGPGFGQGNDEPFRRANQVIHDAGMDMWICGGSWTHRRLMFCPSNEATNHWFEAAYIYMATQYGIEGLDISHARYPMGSMPRGLFCCACDNCARVASEMGYDMEEMVAALNAGSPSTRHCRRDVFSLVPIAPAWAPSIICRCSTCLSGIRRLVPFPS